mmetsp:Transcript_26179/g.57334  ORF Transcript_26179/g.57334 Transcript_26179/m.57334 type:complete len:188 (+) Transcript_26179:86-649(+)|eukprot:CAMPEP_0168179792 /NCGR_PEP_ID=MMETSP0139_2-20121125/10072_1 /TAXON_ID=44445 /ORGANISM="Pseudo-nitzschia australis, Strain 10249 10 AB" /LENGTH=187 /DNA_ID=CAMNT_0008099725 /DNA_START=32 /DNA_END=595 /DNA_ORIENTATION=+
MNTTASIHDPLANENGIIAASKTSKLRRLPFSPRQDNIRVISKTSTSKPNKSIATLKTIQNEALKRSMNNEATENIGEWSTGMLKGSTHEKTSKILPLEESLSCTYRAELCSDVRSSIFREMVNDDDRDDMMVLKRATPVYDSDDDEDYECIPSKKRKTSGEKSVLQWGGRLEESPDGFSLMGLFRE